METKQKLTKLLIHIVLVFFSIIMIVPFIWMFLTAFKTQGEATSIDPFIIFPTVWNTSSFSEVWKNMNFFKLYLWQSFGQVFIFKH